MNSEFWRVNPRFPSYQISSEGKVKRFVRYRNSSPDGSMKIRAYGKFGYQGVCLSEENKKKSILLHRLIAETFLGPCPPDKEVNHIDGNKKNNAYSNLEYVTHRENIDHAISLRLYRPWNRGQKTGLVPKSAFKNGATPWNKGKVRAELNK